MNLGIMFSFGIVFSTVTGLTFQCYFDNEIKFDVSLIPAKDSDVLIGQASPYSARYYFNLPLAQGG